MWWRVALRLQVVDRHFQVAHAQLGPVRRHGDTNQLQVRLEALPAFLLHGLLSGCTQRL